MMEPSKFCDSIISSLSLQRRRTQTTLRSGDGNRDDEMLFIWDGRIALPGIAHVVWVTLSLVPGNNTDELGSGA